MVGQVDRGKIIELPVDVGDFYTPEEAMKLQKPFHRNDGMMTDKQPTEERSEVRNHAIELVEKLPESMLDEAIKVLESLHVQG